MLETTSAPTLGKANARNAVFAGFLGWTIDAFDFFVLVFAVSAIAKDFGRSIPSIALAITASLITRPVGAFIFGLLADRFGRRPVLISNIIFFTLMEVLSGLAHGYKTFFVLRLLYGVGMGGNWGVAASLALESVPARWRGLVSGLLQEGYALGNGLAALAFFVIFPRWGWRAMFFVGAVPALLTLVICARVKETDAWQQTRTDWSVYRRAVFSNLPVFAYMAILMTMMTFVSHGTQDMYPTFLQRQRGFSVNATALITGVSVAGALVGGLSGGHLSGLIGRKRMMMIALLLALITVPLWIAAPNEPLIILGAFLMQMMVQAAWGVVPAHINELSPPQLRGFFPGLAYQVGVLISSSIGYIQAILGEHFQYATAMGVLAAAALIGGIFAIWMGTEKKGVEFANRRLPL